MTLTTILTSRSVYNAPGTQLNDLDAWNYAFEADNGIRQEATGVMKAMDDGAQVNYLSRPIGLVLKVSRNSIKMNQRSLKKLNQN